MDKFPMMWNGRTQGELMTEREPMYTWFTARTALPGEGLWCAWVVGDRGELRVGILEPEQNGAAIRRRFSHPMTAHLGQILRGELRPAAEGKKEPTGNWEPVTEAGKLFRTPWLQKQLQGKKDVLRMEKKGVRKIALPYEKNKPFPLTELFCFAQLQRIGEKFYVVFAFDREELPIFDKNY